MRGCLLLIVGFALGAGLVFYWWPRIPAGQPVPAASDVRIIISDGFITRAVQQRVAGMTLPSIQQVRVTSNPPSTILVHIDLTTAQVSAPAALEIQPIAENGQIQVHVVSTNVAGIPVPPPLAGFVADAINSHSGHVLGDNARVTGVEVVPGAVEILANYG